MATYTVNISGTLNSSYAYATLAGTKTTTTGTKTYTSKPTIAVYVSSSNSSARSNCKVTLNGTTVKTGYGSYTADIGEADIVNITFASAQSGYYTYYTCDITTETSDPMAPHDGHNTNIGNVAYEINGATARMNGVGYKVASGMTRVNGVAMEIKFEIAPEGSTLNECSWENISEISSEGMASNYWDVGDTKTITINGTAGATTFSNLSIAVFIIGFDHNSAKEGANRIHFQIGKINGVDVALCDSQYRQEVTNSGYFNMRPNADSSGGWSSSHMRTTILGSDTTPTSPRSNTLLACLPSDLRAVMKPVTKYSDNTGNGSDTSSNVTATTDYLWLLSEFEVHGSRTYANSAEQNSQTQYDYYKSGNSKKKYRHTATSTTVLWWLRSVRAVNKRLFCAVETYGDPQATGSYYPLGVSPGFAA